MSATGRVATLTVSIGLLLQAWSPEAFLQGTEGATTPPGASKSARTKALEAGARVLQASTPLRPFDIYLVGFHPMKDRPDVQVVAHHYCHQVNEEFAQCVIFDGNAQDANLNGVEYIISERLFETLPMDERRYWHPHNGEILSGQLAAPSIPEAAEKALMKAKMNSYGKTWHFWNTGGEGMAPDRLPFGAPMLAWSLNRDGEAAPGLTDGRDKQTGTNTADKRKRRSDLEPLARPQSGVDDLKEKFGRPTRAIPGVVDKKTRNEPVDIRKSR